MLGPVWKKQKLNVITKLCEHFKRHTIKCLEEVYKYPRVHVIAQNVTLKKKKKKNMSQSVKTCQN